MTETNATQAAGSSEPACSPPPHELACRMLNAIAPEVERINRRANDMLTVSGERQEGQTT